MLLGECPGGHGYKGNGRRGNQDDEAAS
ncbi:MAG: hypothetical protein EHM39_04345 [Chloroflexi bacterium]|nr:MAG: hypothetical protein EHM39_04345 [Chloroflexota bacterium]